MTSLEAPFDVLDWDSDLFGFPVARLRSHVLIPQTYGNALKTLKDAGIRLAYAVTPWDDREARAVIEQAGGSMVDRRVRYRKGVSGTVAFPSLVVVWPGQNCTPELESLALESGNQSRFRMDPKIPPDVFPKLYLTWIRRSVLGEIADTVLVSMRAGRVTGMVSLNLNGTRAEVGLMAVDQAHRGAGIGLRLMEAAEAWAHAHGAETLDVVTQGANTGACTLYKASGCLVAEEEAVYHVWLEPAR
jgi:dTDP-4-amino-4,6-dideoxy-D-galactose acyltransferase